MGLLTKDRDIHILPLSFENAKDEESDISSFGCSL